MKCIPGHRLHSMQPTRRVSRVVHSLRLLRWTFTSCFNLHHAVIAQASMWLLLLGAGLASAQSNPLNVTVCIPFYKPFERSTYVH